LIGAGAFGARVLWPAPDRAPSRLATMTPGIGGTGASSGYRHLTFTPDGEGLVYMALGPDGEVRLFRQTLYDEAATLIPGTEQLSNPLLAPDGRSLLATRVVDGVVFRLPAGGGTAERLANVPFRLSDGAWSPDGSLWMSGESDGGFQVSQLVGDSFISRLGNSRAGYLQQVMRDGRTALMVQSRLGSASGPMVLLDLESGQETPLLATLVVEARLSQGYLVYTTATALLQAIRFDAGSRKVVGAPITLGRNVSITGNGIAQMTVSENGNIAYVPEEPFSLVYIDRDGSSREAAGERHNYHHPMFSPDGRRLSTDFNTAEGRNVWVMNRDDGSFARATFDQDGHDATWTPDGRFLTYIAPVAARGGELALLRKPPGSAEPAETLFSSARLAYTGQWLRDGSALITTGASLRGDTLAPDSLQANTRTDIGILRNGGRGPLEPLVASGFAEQFAAVSPDDRWLAFVSDQSGRDEVYLRDLQGSRDQLLVSSGGGSEPVWSPDGRELYYRETAVGAHLVAARIATSPAPAVTSRTRLFSVGDLVATNPHANYDISPDGRTFVAVRRSLAARIVVIQNFPALIRRLGGQ
jgi:serine/threonine-protein kinase